MVVVIINDNAEINGGAAKTAILSARALADRGHTVHFLCAVPGIAEELRHPLITVVCSDQYEILNDPHRLRAFAQGWWNHKAERVAQSLFAKLNPAETVVHVHLWAKALSSSVVRVAIQAGFMTLCTLHDFLLACPTGTLFQHHAQTICSLKPMSAACIQSNCDTRSYPQKLWRVGRQAIQSTVGGLPQGIQAFIAHSDLVADVMRPYLPGSAPIYRLPIYTQAHDGGPALPEEHERFVYIGRLVREKGVLLLARAADAEQLELTYVGAGPLAEEITSIHPTAEITGWQDHASTVHHLRRSRALIFPSLWYETLGLVVLEAASQGIPSVVPHRSAAAEIVVHGVTGLHFRTGDEKDLRSQLRRLQDPGSARSLGRAAYEQFWKSEYASPNVHISSLEQVYATTLKRRQQQSTECHPLPIPTEETT